MSNALGICLGASTVSVALRTAGEIRFSRLPHDGKVARVLDEVLAAHRSARLGITGRKFRKFLAVPTVSEPEAIELAFASVRDRYPATDCILSAGGETFIAYVLDAGGRIKTIHTGNKCASGTGEFFLQQITRMGLGIDAALELAASAATYPVAGRCSVFCKSDCTHALNKGVAKGPVVAGLCQMMAGKMVELLHKSEASRVAIVGGVSRNPVVMDFVRQSFPNIYVPQEAPGFEALGALLWAEQRGERLSGEKTLYTATHRSFGLLPELHRGLDRVSFKAAPRGEFYRGDYLVGLDVGSTTTKAVLVRTDNQAIVAGTYLRTDGDPVGASRECYRQLLAQVPAGHKPVIVGLGVTGSGRQIAGLHALTGGVVNEIVAHAAAAVHFDPAVETIFEIGGQDAKYTWITNRVPSDYAMNEACSAGTGSFLEEACRESLGIGTEEIAGIALRAETAPNFSDQCAAFISSDIKTAVQEGVGREEIAAGLVYSVCQNYLNRVKGNRPVGKKIFMQGGVCYNRAVPAAMAELCGQQIVVPPEPGLMGAFGAALEVQRRLESGLLERQSFDLAQLAARQVEYRDPFVCRGDAGSCDRKCSIARIVIDGRTYPFGGACDRYYNLRRTGGAEIGGEDLVSLRERLVFDRYAPAPAGEGGRSIGLLPSLLTHTLYPLYAHFFTALGLRVVRVEEPDPAGMEAAGAAFCYPALLSHGLLGSLLQQEVDHIFLPHVKNAALAPAGGNQPNCTCPFVQGEPYYLKATFHRDLAPKLLTAVLDFQDQPALRQAFVRIGRQLGFARREAIRAFETGWQALAAMRREMQEIGRRYLESLTPEETGIVLFGRAYNAFSRQGNMGIPHKFASRGYRIIPHDFLPAGEAEEGALRWMFWTSGRDILRTAEQVRRQPNLFGVYVTNFSCGPDSFLVGHFRDLMGEKPSLMLELDAHTADAGIDTRIEAFLDVVAGYRQLAREEVAPAGFTPARVTVRGGRPWVETGNGRRLPLTDPKVRLLVPSMGDASSRGVAAAFRYAGINAVAAEPPGREELRLGKGVATCKECLPLLLTAGTLRKYLREVHRPDEVLVYFMVNSDGPCRLGQYRPFFDSYVRKNRLDNVAMLSLSCENGYAGISTTFTRRAWQALCIADGLDDVQATMLALAVDPQGALSLLQTARERIFASLARDSRERLLAVLAEEMGKLAGVARKGTLDDAPKVTIVGEIYVRNDDFSRQHLVERLAAQGIVVHTAPVTEWLHYSDYCVTRGLTSRTGLADRLTTRLQRVFKERDETAIQKCFSLSGFYEPHRSDMHALVPGSSRLIDPSLVTEATLTVASTLVELGDVTHGVISIGPFGCMPNRIAEAILGGRLAAEKPNFSPHNGEFWGAEGANLPLPFLAIETDGNAFPQVVEARLESFVLGVRRLKAELAALRSGDNRQDGEKKGRTACFAAPPRLQPAAAEAAATSLHACRRREK
ncbi:MAG TPA: acyl-CoA dehydratase activase [Desulfuromonadales bacterium]|nr:acyl-CoA dehydratase activase [Desulfuromonadales bacterium]